MDALEEIERGGMQNCFVEMNACEGSCIGGPVMHRYHSAPITGKTRVEQYSGKSGRVFDDEPADDLRKSMQYIGSGAVKPGEAAIQEVLHKLGKYRPEERAQLRFLRIQHLPGKGHCGLPGQGRPDHVPALPQGEGRDLLRQDHSGQHPQRHHWSMDDRP